MTIDCDINFPWPNFRYVTNVLVSLSSLRHERAAYFGVTIQLDDATSQKHGLYFFLLFF